MSLWQHQKIHKISLFLWMRTIWIVFVAHLSLLLALFFCYRNNLLINYEIKQGSAPIIISDHYTIPKKNNKELQSTEITKQKPSSLPKKEVKSEDKKVSVSKIEPKKEAIIPVEQKKKLEQKLLDKSEKKELIPEQKKVACSEEKNPVLKTQKGECKKEVIEKNGSQVKESTISEKNAEIERRCAALHNDLLSRWRAPHGVKDSVACTIRFFVNFDGRIENVVIEKSSGILLFDVAAKGVIYGTPMPRWVRGKSMTITFN